MIQSRPIAELTREKISLRLLKMARWTLFGLFLASLGLVAARTSGAIGAPERTGWPESLLVLSAAGTTLLSLARQLPGQNVLLAATIIGVIGGFAEMVNAFRAIPFGPCIYTESAGPRWLGALPWWIPLAWIVAVLNSRGVGRLILRPWRKTRSYGFRLIGLTIALVLVLDLGLEPFATKIKSWWLWGPTQLDLGWHGTPAINFLGCALTTLIILAFATPSLINKKPVSFAPDYQPLITWILLDLLFVIGAATHHLWMAAAVGAGAAVGSVVLALRGAKW